MQRQTRWQNSSRQSGLNRPPKPPHRQKEEQMADQSGEFRVLDERLKAHARRLEILESNQKSLSEGLVSIQKSLSQIKWIATGMVVMFLIQQFGLAEVLRRLL